MLCKHIGQMPRANGSDQEGKVQLRLSCVYYDEFGGLPGLIHINMDIHNITQLYHDRKRTALLPFFFYMFCAKKEKNGI